MESIEITAATLDAATAEAAEKLGVSASKLKVTVLEQSSGLFGKTTVKIKAEVKGGAAPKASKSKKSAEPVVEETPVTEEEVAAPVEVAKPAKAKKAPAKKAAPAAEAAPEEVASAVDEVVATEDDAKKIQSILTEILSTSELAADITVKGVNGRYINLDLDGPDAGYLVGKHGEVLNALQYLSNIISNQQLGNGVRIALDGNHYREKREASLVQLAERIAAEVKKRNQEALLDALPAFERRIIHKALSSIEGVTTYSEGEEPNRRVVIAPAS